MNSLVRVFSNFKEFYSEINGATLTGAIDVIVVEQPDGEFVCSPFHVRFGKLGVLRSREKIVDIEINGEPVDIHMKLGDSGEAFFVEECPQEEIEELPENLATSPIPTSEFCKYEERKKFSNAREEISLPIPRRNSIDLSKEHNDEKYENKFENQVSDFSHRRHTDNTLDRMSLVTSKKEYTTQKIRQEWAEHEDKLLHLDVIKTSSPLQQDEWERQIVNPEQQQQSEQLKEITTITTTTTNVIVKQKKLDDDDKPKEIEETSTTTTVAAAAIATTTTNITDETIKNKVDVQLTNTAYVKDDSKSKKKRRKKSQIKKKNAQQQQQQQSNSQRKSSSSSSIGSIQLEKNESTELDTISLSNNTTGSSNDESSSKIDENSSNNSESLKTMMEIVENNHNKNPDKQCQTTATTKVSTTPNRLRDLDIHNQNPNEEVQTAATTAKATTRVSTTPNRLRDLDIHFFSDTEIATGLSPHCSRPSTPIQSDSELEISQRGDKGSKGHLHHHDDDDIMTNSASWKWGELPQTAIVPDEKKNDADKVQQQRNSMLSGMFSFMKKTNKMRKNVTATTAEGGGVYLSDLNTECMDPEMAALYFPPVLNKDDTTSLNIPSEEDIESGNGTSLPHSPSSMDEGGPKSLDSDYDDGRTEKYLDFVAMSLCGGIEKGNRPSDEEFDQHIIKYSEVCKNPAIFSSPNLVVRLNGKYYSWTAACPIVMTIITFQKPLSDDVVEQLMNESKLPLSSSSSGIVDDDSAVKIVLSGAGNENDSSSQSAPLARENTKRGYSWWYWRRSGGGSATGTDNGTDAIEKQSHVNKDNNGKGADQAAVVTQTTRFNTPDLLSDENVTTNNVVAASECVTSSLVLPSNDNDDMSTTLNKSSTDSNSSGVSSDKSTDFYSDRSNEKYRKTLRLSSKLIKSLNLKPGMNEIEFSVTTAYQGTSRCKCYLFRWKHNDKVVISDIDGTITKSDVLGHILPMVGKDWAQIGVAQLFSKIEANGYKLLYLSARAIGQSRVTREYLRSIRQGDVKLPDGPLLLNPTSLISAFHREVIEKKPEQFKIACLTDIQTLFPENPFYAGYGNRINDVWAYRAVGIPIMRIFTINTKGELKHELTQTFQSSYTHQSLEVNEIFPSLQKQRYNNNNNTGNNNNNNDDDDDDEDANGDDSDGEENLFACDMSDIDDNDNDGLRLSKTKDDNDDNNNNLKKRKYIF